MSPHPHARGGATIGLITDLGAVEAAAVVYFRLWWEGAEGQAQVRADFTGALGEGHGATVARAFEDMIALCAGYGRRALMRHGVHCKCLGADEACFAHFIETAATGAREDAMLMATLLVRADVAPLLASLASDVGLGLTRMRLSAPRDFEMRGSADRATTARSRVLH